MTAITERAIKDNRNNVRAFCRLHNVIYVAFSGYSHSYAAAVKKDLRTSNGMLYHTPRSSEPKEFITHSGYMLLRRAYLIWQDEPIDQVIEALAFLKMTTNRQLYLLRAPNPTEKSCIETSRD